MQRHVSECPKQVFLISRHARRRRRRRFHLVVTSDVALVSPTRFTGHSLERPILFSATRPLLHGCGSWCIDPDSICRKFTSSTPFVDAGTICKNGAPILMPRSRGWTSNDARGLANLNIKYHHHIISGPLWRKELRTSKTTCLMPEQCDPGPRSRNRRAPTRRHTPGKQVEPLTYPMDGEGTWRTKRKLTGG
jgi:hypothetical protein